MGISRVTVHATLLGAANAKPYTTRTNQNGGYRIEGLPKGVYRIQRGDTRGYPRGTSGSTAAKIHEAGPGVEVTGIDYALRRPDESGGFVQQ